MPPGKTESFPMCGGSFYLARTFQCKTVSDKSLRENAERRERQTEKWIRSEQDGLIQQDTPWQTVIFAQPLNLEMDDPTQCLLRAVERLPLP